MGKKYKLSDYVEKIEALYAQAREGFEKAVKSLAELEDSHARKINSGTLNLKGIEEENQRYQTKKAELQQVITEARKTFDVGAAEIRQTTDTLFKGLYEVAPTNIDLQAAELLKSGMLTDSELLRLAESYKAKGNMTMYRYCGTFADSRQGSPTAHLALASKAPLMREDLMIIDEFTDACLKGLREDFNLSNGIHAHHAKWFEDYTKSAEQITVTVEN